MNLPTLSVLAVAFAVLLPPSPRARAETVEITTCGQRIAGGSGVLTGDLDCSAYPDTAVVIERGKLKLRGFTLRGNPSLSVPGSPGHGLPTVVCEGTCRILGPGTITNGAGGSSNGAACCISGAVAMRQRGRVRGVTLEGNFGTAIAGPEHIGIRDSTIRNNAGGGVMNGVHARIRRSTIADNGLAGVWGHNARGNVVVAKSEITNNGAPGIFQGNKVRLVNSTVTGNGIDQDACDAMSIPFDICVDVLVLKPDVHGSKVRCGDSWSWEAERPTGVCEND